MKMKLNETQYRQILDAVLASENGPTLSDEKVAELLDFYQKNYEPVKNSVVKFLNALSNIMIEDLIRNGNAALEQLEAFSEKLETTVEEFYYEVGQLDDYLIETGGELYSRSTELYNQYKKLDKLRGDADMIYQGIKHLADIIDGNELNLGEMLNGAVEIDETFASKAQQKYFFAKANDTSLPKHEREKWKSMAGEFASKTDFSHLPEKA